ncbi:MAG: hypothetical protein ACP5NS_04845 [Candidatus Pacearchaeota archaeon]
MDFEPQTQVTDTMVKPDSVEVLEGSTGREIDPDKLLQTIKKREQKYQPYKQKLDDVASKNKDYYARFEGDKTNLYEGETPIWINEILPAIETIIPMGTENLPEPDVKVYPNNKKGIELQEKIEQYLYDCWRSKWGMQQKSEQALRNLFASRYVGFKMSYNTRKSKSEMTLLPAGRVMFPDKVGEVCDLPFIIDYVTRSAGSIKEEFGTDPDKLAKITEALNTGSPEDSDDDSLVTITEYWEKEFVAWKFKDVLLGFEANPFWNWGEFDEEGNQISEGQNHLEEPSYPFFFLNQFSFGDEIADPVSQIDLLRSPQDSVVKRKRQVELNAGMANGQLVGAGKKIDKKTFMAIKNTAEEKIWMENADSVEGAVAKLTGRAIDQGVINDMIHTESKIEDISGAHAVSKGKSDPREKTVRGKMFLAGKDSSRQSGIVRGLERLAKAVFDFEIQCMIVFGDEYELEPDFDSADDPLSTVENLDKITSEELKDKRIFVKVVENSLKPKDHEQLKAFSLELANNGKMSTLDLYRILEFPDPEKMARNAVMEQIDPFYLYKDAVSGEKIDPMAIRDVKNYLNSPVGTPMGSDYTPPTPELMQNYLITIRAYIRGEEIDDDLAKVPYSSLTDEQKQAIQMYLMQAMQKAKQMMAQIQAQAGAAPQPGEQPAQEQQPKQQQPNNQLIEAIANAVVAKLQGGNQGQGEQPAPSPIPQGDISQGVVA